MLVYGELIPKFSKVGFLGGSEKVFDIFHIFGSLGFFVIK
jgi:hypothetical protein